jgi:hypothetical protein
MTVGGRLLPGPDWSITLFRRVLRRESGLDLLVHSGTVEKSFLAYQTDKGV